ncbi:MAG: lysozyme [Candidatus Gastranaerophilales bacterium]|nr:lysozyme [Candidatus Gastranaerophilales bacterium]
MEISENGIKLIKELEGCRLQAYDDYTGKPVSSSDTVKGTLTIGVGHTGKDVFKGQTITQDKATQLLKSDIKNVERTINEVVKAPLTQNQYDALCSFVFNIGTGAFRNSTMLKRLNERNYAQAAECFKDWHRGNNVPHLLDNRRKKEKELFTATQLKLI